VSASKLGLGAERLVEYNDRGATPNSLSSGGIGGDSCIAEWSGLMMLVLVYGCLAFRELAD
jgi:hypothetical protein